MEWIILNFKMEENLNDDIEKKAIVYTNALFNIEDAAVSVSDIKARIEEKVFYLLNHDFNALVNLLYRIDVYESKAKNCFGKENKEIAKCLAELIWLRQIEKAKRRMG